MVNMPKDDYISDEPHILPLYFPFHSSKCFTNWVQVTTLDAAITGEKGDSLAKNWHSAYCSTCVCVCICVGGGHQGKLGQTTVHMKNHHGIFSTNTKQACD